MGLKSNSTLQRVYKAAPARLQTLAVTALGANIRRKRYSSEFSEYRDIYVNHQWENSDYWNRYQIRQLDRVLTLARQHTDQYADLPETDFDSDKPIHRQLSEIPFLHEDTLRESPRSLVTDESRVKRAITLSTSGTTGTPKQTHHTASSQSKYWAAIERFWRRGGCVYGDRRASFTGNKIVPTDRERGPYGRIDHTNNRLMLSSYHLGDQTVDQYLDLIDEFGPKFIDGYPSAIRFCAQRALDTERDIRIPACFPTAEMLREEDREIIEEGFSTQVYNQYGSTESAGLVTECPNGNMHVNPEIGIVEVVNDEGEPVADDELGEIVLTGLTNELMPLIKYRIGDLARGQPTYDTCNCGWSMPVIEEIIGRQDEVIVTKDGRRVPMLSYNVFKNKTGVEESQIIQEDYTTIRVKVTPNEQFGSEDKKEIVDSIVTRVGDVDVSVEIVDQIERTASGKFRSVVSHIETDGV